MKINNLKMGNNKIYYENAPIILSMLQYRYDKIDEFDINAVREMAKKFKSDFPVINERFVQSIIVNNDNSETSVSLEDKQFDGVQVMSKNRRGIFTITETKFTYQSHEKYVGWDSFVKTAFEFWETFSEHFKINNLGGLSLRYVNKIKLPLDTKNLTDYFTTHLKDDKNNFRISGFQFKFTSFDYENNFKINISHLLDAPLENYIPYIFDIDVLYNGRVENKKEKVLLLFEKIRDRKNQLFNEGITEKTKNLIS